MAARKYQHGSAAYDFDLFLPAEKRERKNNITPMPAEIKQKTEKKRAEAAARSAVSGVITKVFVIGTMLGLLCGMIYTRVEIAEAHDKISASKKEIETLDREYIRLSVQIEEKTSYSNLEQEALALGMQKPTPDQIIYYRLNKQDKTEKSGQKGDTLAELGK